MTKLHSVPSPGVKKEGGEEENIQQLEEGENAYWCLKVENSHVAVITVILFTLLLEGHYRNARNMAGK